MNKPTCLTCKFHEPFTRNSEDWDEGCCKRFPPQLNMAYLHFDETDTRKHDPNKADNAIQACFSMIPWVFPVTTFDEWCGEWQPKPPDDE